MMKAEEYWQLKFPDRNESGGAGDFAWSPERLRLVWQFAEAYHFQAIPSKERLAATIVETIRRRLFDVEGGLHDPETMPSGPELQSIVEAILLRELGGE